VVYWLKAGRRAARQSAHPEAIAHLRQGLDMLTGLPDTPERAKQELAFQSTLGPVVMATQGYASPEAGQIYTRARALCEVVGETEDIYPVLFGVWLFELVRAKHQEATNVAEELLERAQHVKDPGPRIAGHVALGISLVHTGPQSSARQHFEQAIALHSVEQHLPLALRYSLELGTIANAYCAWSLWLLGYPDQALDRGNQTLALLDRITHPYTQSRALYWNAVLHHFRREWSIVDVRAAGAMKSASEHGFALVRAAGQIMHGAALTAQGQGTAGSEQIREGLEAYRITGARFQRPYHLTMLAEALLTEGLQEQALEALEDAANLAAQSGERYYEAEIHRLKGTLLLVGSPDDPKNAETCFHQALEVARDQEAKSLELRATMSLARLWERLGKADKARALLTPTYQWFTEGLDTPDLEDARGLLDELTSRSAA
jgi:predicted ATPase